MNVIVIYDTASGSKTSIKVMKLLRRYLFHIQKSVFTGTLNPSQFKLLLAQLKELENPETDQIILFYTYQDKDLYQTVFGYPLKNQRLL